MKWVSFKQKVPEEGSHIITASISKEGVEIDSWHKWKKDNLNTVVPKITHWWDGEPNFDLAVSKWWQ